MRNVCLQSFLTEYWVLTEQNKNRNNFDLKQSKIGKPSDIRDIFFVGGSFIHEEKIDFCSFVPKPLKRSKPHDYGHELQILGKINSMTTTANW